MGDHRQTGKLSRCVTSHPFVSRFSESWDVNKHTTRCTSFVSMVTLQCKLVSSWGLSKRRSASGRALHLRYEQQRCWWTLCCICCLALGTGGLSLASATGPQSGQTSRRPVPIYTDENALASLLPEQNEEYASVPLPEIIDRENQLQPGRWNDITVSGRLHYLT